jgi:hypothetical protein
MLRAVMVPGFRVSRPQPEKAHGRTDVKAGISAFKTRIINAVSRKAKKFC